MLLQQDRTVRGLNEARAVQAEIKRLGVQDVELFYDGEINMWAVCQVRQQNTGIVTMDNLDGTKVEKLIMWWCKNEKSEYRAPNKEDVQSVIATVRRAQHWFKKGGDALADDLEAQDEAKRANKEAAHKERVAPHLKKLKKAIREELG